MKHVVAVPLKPPRPLTRTSCDCPSKVFLIKEYQSNKRPEPGNKTYNIFNTHSFVCAAKEVKTVMLNNTFVTSMPAKCLIYGSQYLYKQGLSCHPNILPTNDSYLHISIFNHTNSSINIKSNSLHFLCTIIITGHEFIA